MKIRLGIDGRTGYIEKARELNAPVLLSANQLWKNGRWKLPDLDGLDVALDSGGFVSQVNGGFKFTMQDYVELVDMLNPTWYAAMDICCEPEVGYHEERWFKGESPAWPHVRATIHNLWKLLDVSRRNPVPVIQGWSLRDYAWCVLRMEETINHWPNLVGVGTMCRRNTKGICEVMNLLDRMLPPHVKLHLFGVKGAVLRRLNACFSHRIESIDSFAHAMRARFDARDNKISNDSNHRVMHMERWYHNNTQSQLPLWQ